MDKSRWFLILEFIFVVLGLIAVYAGAPIFLTIWIVFMAAWMCYKSLKTAWEEEKKK